MKNCMKLHRTIRYCKNAAWVGIGLNLALLLTVFVLYRTSLDAAWIVPVLNVLYPAAILSEFVMFGGAAAKALLEYQAGIRGIRQNAAILLAVGAVTGLYLVMKALFS